MLRDKITKRVSEIQTDYNPEHFDCEKFIKLFYVNYAFPLQGGLNFGVYNWVLLS